MKNSLSLLALLALLLSCDAQRSIKKHTSSSTNNYCTLYPANPECGGVGTTPGATSGTTAGTTAGTTSGTTSGTTTSGTTSGTGSGYSYTGTIPSDNNWGDLYNGLNLSSFTATHCGTTGTGYPLRSGTITLSGATYFTPNNDWSKLNPANTNSTTNTSKELQYTSSAYSQNISSYFTDVFMMRDFLESDSLRKVRFKIRPQVKPTTGVSTCYYRRTGVASDTHGYTKLKLTVALRPVKVDGSLGSIIRSWNVEGSINDCTQPIDMSAGIIGTHPYGVVFQITQVERSDSCWYATGCTTPGAVRDSSCWQVDVEAAVDGTVSF